MDLLEGYPKPPRELSEFPNICGTEGVVEFAMETLGIDVKESWILHRAKGGELPYWLIGGKRHFSEVDVYKLLLSRPKHGPRAPRAARAVSSSGGVAK